MLQLYKKKPQNPILIIKAPTLNPKTKPRHHGTRVWRCHSVFKVAAGTEFEATHVRLRVELSKVYGLG